MVAELAALAAAIVILAAEALHAQRVARVARLAFGPSGRPARWARTAPTLRVAAGSAVAWGLTTLLLLPPVPRPAETLPENQRRNVVLILDVSPSMRLKDAGPGGDQTRRERATAVMESFFQRVPIEQYLLSVIAFYSGAKPVVAGTKDMEVVRNILADLPMQFAFPVGKTDLFAGLAEAARIAHPWRPDSTLLIIVSDGDTVPATGMPRLPASISDVLVVGVGDPRAGTFIDGRQSRQDSGALRQIAARLHGTYHDANEKHLPSDLLSRLTAIPRPTTLDRLTRREYALFASGLGAAILAFLPALQRAFGTAWRPGVHAIRRPGRWTMGSERSEAGRAHDVLR
ncbi:vWA domain-containing protein [Tundrisphaera sp. TA3]|uniref:vWA domain-containing protein n=1 Tax=Tundrisphaera sp. TA3 TaxID=3435775 RepID=UPI003EBE58DD